MLPEQFVYLGVICSLVACTFYLAGTIKGTVKPNRVTFFLWALAPLIAFFAQLDEGVGPQALLSFALGFGSLLILGASYLHKNKHAAWKLTRLDYICGAISLIGLCLWQITQIGTIAIMFSIVADIFAAIPTIIKSYKAPNTESPAAYLLTGTGGLITFLTITHWNFANYAFPLYTIVINYFIYGILYFRFKKRLSQ